MSEYKRIDPEDPRLTAYVLGELTGPEKAEFERALEADESARREVEELRAATRQLAEELAHEPAPELRPEQRKRLEARAAAGMAGQPGRSGRAMPPPSSGWFGWRSLASAGLCCSVVMVLSLMGTSKYTGFTVASSRSQGYDRPAPMGHASPAANERDLQLAMVRRPPVAPQPFDSLKVGGYLQSVPQTPGQGPASAGNYGQTSGMPNQGPTSKVDQASGDRFDRTVENAFHPATGEPLSTFSIDVDTASYALVRRFLEHGTRPPEDAVRTEELINYFPYEYPEPDSGEPLTVLAETTGCPWAPAHRLVRIGLKGRSLSATARPASNLVFLIDVSGSMNGAERLPLVIQSLRLLVNQLDERDTIAIVVYAGASGLVLPPTSGAQKERIVAALDQLHAGGSTNGGQGIELAYQTAVGGFIKGGTNRVILCTDGDFNVGVTSRGDLERLIEEKRRTGVFLSVLGFGIGNYQDGTMQKLADRGNGNHAYIDSLREASKVLVEQMGGTLVAVAKDVKVQVEFNPAQVASYRLVGYEKRMLAARDFNDDKKDAGELGAGHTVTALYEVVPAPAAGGEVDPLKYQKSTPAPGATSSELLTVKVRHQKPEGGPSALMTFPVTDRGGAFEAASADTRWAAAVAEFAMVLRNSAARGNATLDTVSAIAAQAKGADRGGHRAEFLQLVDRARSFVR